MKFNSSQDTKEHIGKVRDRLWQVREALWLRGARHDRTKLQEPEKSAYDALMEYKSSHEMVYGSPEYAEGLKILGPALDHHYAANSHHPQHYANGISGMSLLDIIEMCCDWAAAADRHGGLTLSSLENNRKRFGISDQLYAVLLNTYNELDWLKDDSK